MWSLYVRQGYPMPQITNNKTQHQYENGNIKNWEIMVAMVLQTVIHVIYVIAVS